MSGFVQVPLERVPEESLTALLEEFASRDGTDYGEHETPLSERVEQLRRALTSGDLRLVFGADEERWDILDKRAAQSLVDPASAPNVVPDGAE
ncbi:MAG: YheU family protein [Pseudomonadota bacterium]